VRFSTTVGELGSADTVRDIRGFAIKFYTTEGNYDLVGGDSPMFLLRDPVSFLDLAHSGKKNPISGLRDACTVWDFLSHRPDALHSVVKLNSPAGIPDGYRFMNGFGVNTFKWVNADGEVTFIKYHILSN